MIPEIRNHIADYVLTRDLNRRSELEVQLVSEYDAPAPRLSVLRNGIRTFGRFALLGGVALTGWQALMTGDVNYALASTFMLGLAGMDAVDIARDVNLLESRVANFRQYDQIVLAAEEFESLLGDFRETSGLVRRYTDNFDAS